MPKRTVLIVSSSRVPPYVGSFHPFPASNTIRGSFRSPPSLPGLTDVREASAILPALRVSMVGHREAPLGGAQIWLISVLKLNRLIVPIHKLRPFKPRWGKPTPAKTKHHNGVESNNIFSAFVQAAAIQARLIQGQHTCAKTSLGCANLIVSNAYIFGYVRDAVASLGALTILLGCSISGSPRWACWTIITCLANAKGLPSVL